MTNCRCTFIPPRHFDYDRVDIGIDETDGRFAEVSIDTCKYCSTRWIHYFYQIEGISNSGRWYRGMIGDTGDAADITPRMAVRWLEQLEQYMYGGSYYNTEGAWGKGKIK